MTVKNYKITGGLSKRVHSDPSPRFYVKGPMGKGLGMEMHGYHMAFAAGTGILPFIDQIAFIARSVFNKDGKLSETFQFRLYAAFRSAEDSIGLELVQALDKYCRENNSKAF